MRRAQVVKVADSSWAGFDDGRIARVTHDLSEIPPDVEALEIRAQHFRAWSELPALRRLHRLMVSPVRAAELEQVAAIESLAALWIGEVRADSLAPLARLRKLHTLAIHWAPRPASLAGVTALTGLRSLTLWDMPRLPVLDELAALSALRELVIETAPSRDARGPQRFPTLQPLAALTRLERLVLTGVAAQDKSLVPLQSLKQLRELRLTNCFPLAEYARLAAALPSARGNFAEPVWGLGCGLPCGKCGAEKVLLLGLGGRLRCPTCDAARIAAHVAEFERIRGGGTTDQP
jgi:hypothetical protein